MILWGGDKTPLFLLWRHVMKLLIGLCLLFSLSAFAQTYNCKVTSQAEFVTSSSSTLVIQANASRRCLILDNKDATNAVYIKFGSAHSGTEGLLLRANTRWEAIVPPAQSVYMKAAAGTPTVGFMSGQ